MPRFALFLLLALLALPAHAQDAAPVSPYTVTGIAVDVNGKTSTQARDRAFTDGGRLALAELAKKRAGAKDPDFKSVDNNTVGRLIKSFEVETEKASGTRYVATLTFHFRPEWTDKFLRSRGYTPTDVGDAEAASATTTANALEPDAPTLPRMVVLPIIRAGERNLLWEERTDWTQAWENHLSQNANLTLVVPDGTVEDIALISAAEALAGAAGPLSRVMQRYDAEGVLVAVLAASDVAVKPEKDLNIQLAIYDKSGSMKTASSFNLAAAPGKAIGEWLEEGVAQAAGKWQKASHKMIADQQRPPAAAQPAVISGLGDTTRLTMNVPFTSPQQWQATRAAVEEMNGVTRFDVASLSRSSALAQVSFKGTRRDFEHALAEKNLRLVQAIPSGALTLLPAGSQLEPLPVRTIPGVPTPPADSPDGEDVIIYAPSSPGSQ